MIVKCITSSGAWQDDHDDRAFFRVEIDGELELSFMDGEPEDANMLRDFNDIFAIPSLLDKVVQAVQNGEKVTIVQEVADEWKRR